VEFYSKMAPSTNLVLAYSLFLGVFLTTYHLVAEGAFSYIFTMSVMLQCLAFTLLGIQCVSSQSAAGISARALALDAFAFCCQLSSTTWLQGYLPTDASGDWLFQMLQICAFILVMALLRHVLVDQKATYQPAEDSCPVVPLMLLCVLLGGIFHGDMNNRPLFDTLWMTGLFAGTVAVLPQLWLITQNGGHVEALTSHYIASLAVGRFLSGLFMWYASDDITCNEWITGFNQAVWAIHFAHLLHLLCLADFAWHYMKAMALKGLTGTVELELVWV